MYNKLKAISPAQRVKMSSLHLALDNYEGSIQMAQ